MACGRAYPFRDGIPDFRHSDEYWCNVSKEKMRLLNDKARTTNDWLSAAKEIIPEYLDHFVGFQRADAQFLFPSGADARILDAGSMWGGLTIPVAQYSKEVYAIDKTIETLSFLRIRAGQMGFSNIHTVAADLEKLPFESGYFDLVILNGVLDKALELMGTGLGGVLLTDEKPPGLSYQVLRGLGADSPGAIAGVQLAREVTRRGETQTADMTGEPVAGVAAIISVPLKSKERVVGVLNIASRTPRPFSQQEVQLLTSFGHQLGIAVENAQLYRELQLKEQLRLNFTSQSIGGDSIF